MVLWVSEKTHFLRIYVQLFDSYCLIWVARIIFYQTSRFNLEPTIPKIDGWRLRSGTIPKIPSESMHSSMIVPSDTIRLPQTKTHHMICFLAFKSFWSRVMTWFFVWFHWKASHFLVRRELGLMTHSHSYSTASPASFSVFSGCGGRPWTSKNQPTSPTHGRWGPGGWTNLK